MMNNGDIVGSSRLGHYFNQACFCFRLLRQTNFQEIAKCSYIWVLLLIVITSVLGFSLRFIDNNEEVELTSEETHIIVPNRFFLKQIEMEDPSNRIHTFFFDEVPQLSKIINIEQSDLVTLEYRKFKSWGRYLNQGSQAILNWKLDGEVTVSLIRGEKQLQQWLKGKNTVIKTEKSLDGNLAFHVLEPDDYFFVIENNGLNQDLKGSVSFSIAATSYDTTKAKGYFEGRFRMDFDFGRQQYLVLSNPSLTAASVIRIHYSTITFTLVALAFVLEVFWLIITFFFRRNHDQPYVVSPLPLRPTDESNHKDVV